MLTRVDWRGEWLIVRRHPLIWIVATVAIAIVALAAGNDAAGDKRELLESLLRLNLFIPAFVLPFVAGALAPVFYLREVDHGVSELFAAYPQTPRMWLASRSGSFAAMLVLICAFQQAAIVGILAFEQPVHLAMLTKQALKARQFDPVHLHQSRATQLESIGEIKNGKSLAQQGQRLRRRQVWRVGAGSGARCPCR